MVTPLAVILLVCALAYDGLVTAIALGLAAAVELVAYAMRKANEAEFDAAYEAEVTAQRAAMN